HLPPADLEALVDLVYTRRDPKAPPAAEHKGGALLEKHECDTCHEVNEAASLDAPALFRYQSLEWVTEVLEDASDSHLYGAENSMPAFKARLGAEDRQAVAAFLMSLENRGPQDRWPWVDDPGPIVTPRPGDETTQRASQGVEK